MSIKLAKPVQICTKLKFASQLEVDFADISNVIQTGMQLGSSATWGHKIILTLASRLSSKVANLIHHLFKLSL